MHRASARPLMPLIAALAVGVFLASPAAAAQENVEIDTLADNHSNSGGTNGTPTGTANTETCDANLGDLADATGDDAWDASASAPTGTVHLVCVSAEDAAGAELEGQSVTLTSTGAGSLTDSAGGAPVMTASAPIDSGYAEFYVSSSAAGTQTLTASISGVTDTDIATFTWLAACPGHENDKRNQVVGTAGNDTLAGTGGKDVICGLDGDDVLSGLAGKDLLLGSDGNDTLNGGNGKDVLAGDSGDDTLNGGNGKDRLDGGPDTDACNGGRGKDGEQGCE